MTVAQFLAALAYHPRDAEVYFCLRPVGYDLDDASEVYFRLMPGGMKDGMVMLEHEAEDEEEEEDEVEVPDRKRRSRT